MIRVFKVEVLIKDVDYEDIADKVIPIVIKKLSDKGDKTSKLARVLAGLKGMPTKLAKAALSVLPQHTKDELAIHFLTEYKDDIVSYINRLVHEKEIAIEVEDIKIEKI